ncbi:cytochrome C [Thalassotalea sp. 1_MG-2023]|uniref:Vgb family protein n=1 Tax=Thalassotalea sp. 1_MG-2023 TaxID=3062680 RepID=UPI0026E32D36|nr:cytochrome C [Thalassotalea sp. 1_MG-2023]MDO6427973.1 cytochrome C [Thalassotalea sp. 1_MG-2023]
MTLRFIKYTILFIASSLLSLTAFTQPYNNMLVNDPMNNEGKALVEQYCTACHRINMITRSSGYNADGWQTLIHTMINFSNSPAIEEKIVSYLAKNYPPNDKRTPNLISGDTEISFTTWHTPTLGQRSRDPIEAENGDIWWAGQRANLIGRIDPDSGEMKEYTLPDNAMPHTVTTDSDGNIWYTGNKNGTMGKLNIKTEAITEFPMPDKQAKDPHSAIFDNKGILWFTLQHSNMIGRLNPESGEIKLVTMNAPKSKPYGIKIDDEGTPWVACNGRNCLVKVDPKTMALTDITLPNKATRVRRLDIAADGMIWYVNSSQGRLGRYNPDTGDIKEWPSPSGNKSHPYAIAVIDNIVWYNESGMRPDALVRFDPKSEIFQSWAIPSGDVYAGIVRHMRKTKQGDLLIHQSSTSKVIRVNIE